MSERIDIVVTQTGAQKASQDIASVGDSAEKTGKQTDGLTSSLDFLKTALAGIAVFALVKQYTELADTYTGIINRLKLVSTSAKDLIATEQKLFEVANATRGSFDHGWAPSGTDATTTKHFPDNLVAMV